jgi:hypothetical protein
MSDPRIEKLANVLAHYSLKSSAATWSASPARRLQSRSFAPCSSRCSKRGPTRLSA